MAMIPISDGATGIRTSALLPVTERPDSNWTWSDGQRSGERVRAYCAENSTGESQAPRKSASRPTMTRALSKA